jgi:hypothetical protein
LDNIRHYNLNHYNPTRNYNNYKNNFILSC